MSDIRDDYLKFRVEDDTKASGGLIGSMIKILVIILLLLLLVVLGAVAYKYLFKDDKIAKAQPQQIEIPVQNDKNTKVLQSVTNAVENQGGTVKKEEIALIVKSVLAQMNQEKDKKAIVEDKHQTSTNPTTTPQQVKQTGDDASLLNDLSSADVDNAKEEDINLSALDDINSNKKIDNQKKKSDNFNKVILEIQEVASKDDLSKLYNQLNKIMKKDKNQAKNSSYVSKIKKETKVRKNAMRIIRVRKGDTLSLIAARAYGDAMMYPKIFAANPDLVKNPNMIFPGQKLRVPK
jgi:nucleoid-associated protein YgaU